MITLRGPNGTADLPVDVRAELEEFPWINAEWSTDKLVAASPFRYERNPSFAVIFEHGGWRDWGAISSEYETGGIVKLLAFLRDETYDETAEYLTLKYGTPPDSSGEVTLTVPKLTLDKPRIIRIDDGILDGYKFRHPYLAGRGISESAQRLMRIGYDRQRKAITIPWFNPDGSLGNVKYRRVDSKTFWYAKAGRPIREMLYGINVAYRQRLKRAAIVEAEVDALTLMSAGIFAIATGGTAFNRTKAELLLRSPIEEIMLYRDNDSAGRTWRNRIVAELGGKMDVRLALMPAEYKDVNDAAQAGWDVSNANIRNCRTMTINIR